VGSQTADFCEGVLSANRYITAIISREGNGYVSLCPELDVASQGQSVENASRNLAEAVELFLETADETEIRQRWASEVWISFFEVGWDYE